MKINGRITNYRTGPKSQQSKECLIQFNTEDSGSVGTLVGQKVVWTNGKSRFSGKIVGMHGRNGMVRVKFARPLPGQALGTDVELIS
jgi:large subunit ribosomal protein L35Ae